MAYELDIRDAVINAIQVGSTIEGLKVKVGLKDPQKTEEIANEPGTVFVRYMGGGSELFIPVQFDDGTFHNAGQNQICRYEIYIALQRWKQEDEIVEITSMLLDILSNNKVGETVIQPLVCVQYPDFEVLNNVIWQKLIFETRYKIKGVI